MKVSRSVILSVSASDDSRALIQRVRVTFLAIRGFEFELVSDTHELEALT